MPAAWETINFGDSEAAIVDILLNDTPEISNLVPFDNISTNLIGYVDGDRWIYVVQLGASERWPRINKPRIDVQVRAERRSVALDITNFCLASIKRAMGNYSGFGVNLTDVRVEQGITRVSDPLIESSRYTFAVRLTTVPFGVPLTPPSS